LAKPKDIQHNHATVKQRFIAVRRLDGTTSVNRPGISGDSIVWKGWSHVRWFIEEVPAGAA
ncbi:MAG: hypothetical protein ACLPLP_24670, partial [Mycobacterium sp.]